MLCTINFDHTNKKMNLNEDIDALYSRARNLSTAHKAKRMKEDLDVYVETTMLPDLLQLEIWIILRYNL